MTTQQIKPRSETVTQSDWPYPGSRWWKFDFHTHTPASKDTHAWQKAIGSTDEVTPKQWLLRYMAAGIDCVAVTDHNSGDWIDRLQDAYKEMEQQTNEGSPPDGFRELTIFPGVEISVNGGFHLLAIFDPEDTTRTISNLLATVGYGGTPGDSDEVTTKSPKEVLQAVMDSGGIPIPAHADQNKGLLQVDPGTRKSKLDANTLRQVINVEGLLAVEWGDISSLMPACVKEQQASRLTKILGSDCHSFQGNSAPGSRFTWIKMETPAIEGLRLALLDGNDISVQRVQCGNEDSLTPFATPTHFITKIEIETARYMGNDLAENLEFNPCYNAVIGGRGTGKSTIIHALRLAYRREEELELLAGPLDQFKHFSRPVKERDGGGALRDNTEIRVEINQDGVLHLLRWRCDGNGECVEEREGDADWKPSRNPHINKERFPVRIFSQGQIAAMAGENRQALLGVIDEAAGVGDLDREFEKEKNQYFTQQAKLRELHAQMQRRAELERKREELNQKINTLSQSPHAELLKDHQQCCKQQNEVAIIWEQLQKMPGRIELLTEELYLDDWPEKIFDGERDADMLAWRADADHILKAARDGLTQVVRTLDEKVRKLRDDDRLANWQQRVKKTQKDYEALQASLTEQGISDPQAFSHLIQQRQLLGEKLKQLGRIQQEYVNLQAVNATQWLKVLDARVAITQKRKEFLTKLSDNDFVRIDVIGFGFDARNIERNLRALLEIQNEHFEKDILLMEDQKPTGGLAGQLATDDKTDDKKNILEDIKQKLINIDDNFGGRFRKYLDRKLQRAEFADHIRCWFPDDDLRIEYSRRGDGHDWSAITQGSQGQRSAALLAFLLAFGNEPLILDQPEDDLDNNLIYDLIVRQIRENKQRRQLIIVTHNPNVVVNGDAEMVHVLDFQNGQCRRVKHGALQNKAVREEVCRIMEGGREAFARRWARLGRDIRDV